MVKQFLRILLGFYEDIFEEEYKQTRNGNENEVEDETFDSLNENFNTLPKFSFKSTYDTKFINASEKLELVRFAKLGFFYRVLKKYASKTNDISYKKELVLNYINKKTDEKTSAVHIHEPDFRTYQRALASGVEEILHTYQSVIVEIEKMVLKNNNITLRSIFLHIEDYECLFPPLSSLLFQIRKEKIHGGPLLNLLYQKTCSGILIFQKSISRLLLLCHQSMYIQLRNWMMYGILNEVDECFFITFKPVNEKIDQNKSIINENNEYINDGVLENEFDWWNNYQIRGDMKPQYISPKSAESILFIGKTMKILKFSKYTFKNEKLQKYPSVNFQEGTHFTSHSFSESESKKMHGLVKELQNPVHLQTLFFENVIEYCRTLTSRKLWEFFNTQLNLNKHFELVKDFFLLSKADFFRYFIESSNELMKFPPRSNDIEKEINLYFEKAAQYSLSEKESNSFHFSLKFSDSFILNQSVEPNLPSRLFQTKKLDWNMLALEHLPPPPLRLIFTKEALKKYNDIFQYLFLLKRTQLRLENAFVKEIKTERAKIRVKFKVKQSRVQSQSPTEPSSSSSSSCRPTPFSLSWELLQRMLNLITNLQFYIQVDVIEVNFDSFQNQIQKSKDFGQLLKFHAEFLDCLINQCYLNIGIISKTVKDIIKICMDLCEAIENEKVNNKNKNKNNKKEESVVQTLKDQFEKRSISFYTLLRNEKLISHQRAPHLRLMLMKLNFNKYYENAALEEIHKPKSPT